MKKEELFTSSLGLIWLNEKSTTDSKIKSTTKSLCQFKKEVEKKTLILAKAMTEHLTQDERNEWFDIKLNELTKQK